MRDLVYRAKKSSNEEWVVSGTIVQFIDDGIRNTYMPAAGKSCKAIHDDENDDVLEFKDVRFYKIVHETLGQWTNKSDIDNARIFEGDILEVSTANIDAEVEGYGVVTWNKDSARYEVIFDGLCIDFDNFYDYECKIVGNIFDNPERAEFWLQE